MKSILIRFGLPVLAVFWVGGCDFIDTTGSLFISEQDEVKLGTEFDNHLRTNDSAKLQFPIFVPRPGTGDTAFQQYVENLAQSILSAIPVSEKPGYPFKFTIVNANVDNAFAVPGGFVYIYTGIIKHMQDESELAGVLGHEISHVTRHHYRDALVKQSGLSLLVQALLGNDAGKLAQLVAQSFSTLTQLSISRGNESEADQYGTIYEGKIGHNPMGIAKFFSRMESQSITILSTHPQPVSRVADVTAQVNADATLRSLAADSANTNFASRFMLNTATIRQ